MKPQPRSPARAGLIFFCLLLAMAALGYWGFGRGATAPRTPPPGASAGQVGTG